MQKERVKAFVTQSNTWDVTVSWCTLELAEKNTCILKRKEKKEKRKRKDKCINRKETLL